MGISVDKGSRLKPIQDSVIKKPEEDLSLRALCTKVASLVKTFLGKIQTFVAEYIWNPIKMAWKGGFVYPHESLQSTTQTLKSAQIVSMKDASTQTSCPQLQATATQVSFSSDFLKSTEQNKTNSLKNTICAGGWSDIKGQSASDDDISRQSQKSYDSDTDTNIYCDVNLGICDEESPILFLQDRQESMMRVPWEYVLDKKYLSEEEITRIPAWLHHNYRYEPHN